MRKMLLLSLLAAGALLASPEHLPLRTGNTWTYRQAATSQEFTITVGLPALIDANTYYRLTGYVSTPLWVRFGEDGNLFYRDEENSRDALLTGFQPVSGGWYDVPFRVCEQQERPEDVRAPAEPPFPFITSALVLRYRVLNCADAGVTEEQYAPNVGLIQRTVTTIAGPRTYSLVRAQVGALSVQPESGARTTLTLQEPSATGERIARLEIRINGPEPFPLHFNSSQEFDFALRNAAGQIVWTWSADKSFLQVIRDESTLGRSWSAVIPLAGLSPGRYSLEGWVTSGYDRFQFAAATPVIVESPAQ